MLTMTTEELIARYKRIFQQVNGEQVEVEHRHGWFKIHPFSHEALSTRPLRRKEVEKALANLESRLPLQIVLAKTVPDYEVTQEGRIDKGESHRYKEIQRPVACMWLNEGTQEDKVKAEEYARPEGYTVFCYIGEDDPLGKAKKDIMSVSQN